MLFHQKHTHLTMMKMFGLTTDDKKNIKTTKQNTAKPTHLEKYPHSLKAMSCKISLIIYANSKYLLN